MYKTSSTLPILLLTCQLGQSIAVGFSENRAAGVFDYADFSVWGPTCGTGTNQQKGSPIDIKTAETASASNKFNFLLQNSVKKAWGVTAAGGSLKGEWARKGFTFQFTVTDDNGGPMLQYNSEFTDSAHNYELLQIHYHWGADNNQGSEHTVNENKHPLEAHFVHGNTKYKADGSYLDHEDGLLVVGVLYKIFNSASGDDETATNWIKNVGWRASQYANAEAAGNAAPIETTSQWLLWKTMTEALKEGHWNYKGSLTTPGCQEVVTWVVGKKIMPVKSADLANFRKLRKDGSAITRNWRPTQDIGTGNGKRVVFSMDASWEPGSWEYYQGR